MPGITDPTEAYFKDGQWGWDGSQWRKLMLLWGYNDRLVDAVSATKSGAGNYQRDSTAVPAGYVYVIQSAGIHNQSGARGMAYVAFLSGGLAYYFTQKLTPAQYELVGFNGALVMKEGDQLRWFQASCSDADNIRTYARGYKMKVAE